MSRISSQLNTSEKILDQYAGEEPFSIFLKKFFSGDKKYGSRDRKNITNCCYSFFRLGKTGNDLSTKERILIGLFLTSNYPNPFLEELKPDWNVKGESDLFKKLEIVQMQYPIQVKEIFPWKDSLNDEVDHERFCLSFLIQPDLFLRVRPGYHSHVLKKLNDAAIPFQEKNHDILAVPNGSRLEGVLEIDKEAVVQDLNSQRIAEFLPERINQAWDCCAASGGKSMMVYDRFPKVDLTVTDKRPSILNNLEKRFRLAGIGTYHSAILDLAKPVSPRFHSPFPFIIADVPCTGSGTWGRTPEQLYFFKKEKIEEYSNLQKNILENVVPFLQKDGFLLYSTCSVFKEENENNIKYAEKKFGLMIEKMSLLKGYENKADTLFAALLRKM